MPKPKVIEVTSTVTRHIPQFSRLVTIPLEEIAPWKLTETTAIEGEINGTALGRRSLKRWDDRRNTTNGSWWMVQVLSTKVAEQSSARRERT
jgi:hypothetical protein